MVNIALAHTLAWYVLGTMNTLHVVIAQEDTKKVITLTLNTLPPMTGADQKLNASNF